MAYRDVQNPGIGGLEELTTAEELFIQNLTGLSYAQGDIIYHDGTNLVRLAKGTGTQHLAMNAGATAPEWVTAGGTVTSVSVVTANGISGSVATATTTPAITLTLGAITPTAVAIAGTAGAGYLSLSHQSSAPTSPSAGIVLLSASTGNGFTRVIQNNEALEDIVIGRDNVFVAKNTSGGAITKGQVVYVSGSVGAVPTVSLAKADSLTTLTATIGIATETSVANNGFGQFMIVGILENIDTSAFTTGNAVYVSAATAGLLTNTKPAYPNFQKFVGVVLNSGVGNGSILVNVAPFNGGAELGTNASVFYGTNIQLSGLTASEIVGTDASKNLISLAVATYPSLTELSYVKGVTSAIQTQLDGKSPTAGNASLITVGTVTTGVWNATDIPVSAGGTGLSAITALSVWVANSANTITEVTPGAGNSIRINAGATAWEAFTPLVSGGALGTPSSGTGTNITGIPAANILAGSFGAGAYVISTSLQSATIELGHATDTTLSRVSAGVAAVEGVTIPTISSTSTLTNKSIGAGVLQLEENASIALDPAGSADGKYSGITISGTAGATLAFGDVIVLDVTASKWLLADANSAAAADGDARGLIGMCVLAATDTQATTILLNGTCRADANFPALTITAPVYLSETAGDIQVAMPTTTDVVIRTLGFALTADEIYFSPSSDYITHV